MSKDFPRNVWEDKSVSLRCKIMNLISGDRFCLKNSGVLYHIDTASRYLRDAVGDQEMTADEYRNLIHAVLWHLKVADKNARDFYKM